MATFRIYFDQRRSRKDGTYPIKIVVKHKGEIHFSTGQSCLPSHWKTNELSNKAPNYKSRNSFIRDRYAKIENIILNLERSGDLLKLSDKKLKDIIDEELKGKEAKTFLDIMDEFSDYNHSPRTKEIYKATRNKIAAITPDLTFSDIDFNWLNGFDAIIAEQGLQINARSIHLRNIRAVFNYAIDAGIIELNSYPFRKYKIRKQETPKRSLTEEQIKLIRDYEGPYKEYADYFMLSFYLIGINIKDLLHLKAIKDGRIEYYRYKTGRFYSIEVLEPAMEIIKKYRGKEYLLLWRERYTDYTGFTFRVTTNLKKLSYISEDNKECFICNELTTYYARHTWATIAAKLDIPKETIAAALGHGGKSVTDIYIDFDKKKIDEANRKVINYISFL